MAATFVVEWIGYHDGIVRRHTFYAEHHAEQFAKAITLNGVPGVSVTALPGKAACAPEQEPSEADIQSALDFGRTAEQHLR